MKWIVRKHIKNYREISTAVISKGIMASLAYIMHVADIVRLLYVKKNKIFFGDIK